MKRTIPHPQLLSDFHNPSPIYMTPLLVLNELCLCEHVKICDAVCVNSWVLCCLLLYLSWLWDLFLISEGHLQACALHESSSNNIQEHFIKRTEHDKAIGDINIMLDKGLNELKVLKVNMDKKFAEHKQCFDQAIVILRYELKRDADEQNMKHCVDLLNVKNEMKANDLKMEGNIELRKGELKRLKNLGWFFEASSAIISRFSNLFDYVFKKPGESE
ncbi:hypothetical protein PAHAL_6G280000 [Panicum hallii]|uniref:Uncharacterized protein n=1 Tax=Panicum hallii TaxID=206008 RepID=A0A2T8IHY8_9POAL|nr:hypothetical protein PAHAL_6G279800 [Panicum hallii]PVH37268.1 hypothetical protein PAHAL_6G279900 [Panicum hallii]PVH37269.1 hypothetical protein PAHAL_6G280000 [Panicum hallii]